MADRQESSGLIERLEALTGPDREVDADIWCVLNPDWKKREAKWTVPGSVASRSEFTQFRTAPRYTASIGAALTLVSYGS